MEDIDIGLRPFVIDSKEYKRDGDPVKAWIEAQVSYISKLYGYEEEYVREWVKKQIKPGGCSPFYDRQVKYIHQETLGNRVVKTGSFYGYQNETREKGHVISPSGTTYRDPVKNPVLTASFTDKNVKLRSVFKKIGQDAKLKAQKKIAAKYHGLQAKKKEINNSFSGANSSWFNALCNGSGHQTLTSTCRSAISYANIITERFLAGNRVYVNKDIVLQELSNAVCLADHDTILNAVNKYGLTIPTTDDVFDCAEKSFSKYFRSKSIAIEIRRFIETMDDASRCAFVYLGDFYHLDKHNKDFVTGLFKELTALADPITSECDEYYPQASDDIKSLIFATMKDITKGKLYIDKTGDKSLSPEDKNIINNAIKAHATFINKYADLISAIWRPNYLPSGMGYFRTMLREVILTTDTDSVIMTMQEWTKRVTGSYNFDRDSYTTAFNLVYFVSESISNAFGKFCANIGVPPELIHYLAAKNEYAFSVYCISEIMKHYFAEKEIEEGRVLPTPELEMKGVGYISAKYDDKIESEFKEYITKDIMDNVKKNITLTREQVLGRPMRVEKEVRDIIRSGKLIYQTTGIGEASSYKQKENNATYRQFILWNEVFGPTYGVVDEPPYTAYKVPVKLVKKRDVAYWLENMEDRAIAARAKKFMETIGTGTMSSIQVPMQLATMIGIPKEIVAIIDEKRATQQIMRPFYLALGGLGFFHGNYKNTKLITDHMFTTNP